MISQRLRNYYHGLDHHMKEMVHGTTTALTLRVMGAGLSFGFNVLLARLFGAEGAGIYFLSLTITTIATVFGRMGLDNTLLRFIAANAAVEDWMTLKGVYKKGMTIALVTSIAAALVVFASAPWLAETIFSKPALIIPLRWMTLAVVPVALLNLHAEMLKGLKRIFESQLVQGVGVPALSALGLYLLGSALGVKSAVLAYILATALTALGGLWLWRAVTPQLRGIVGQFRARELLQSSIPLFWVASMNLVMTWTATFALGIWGTSADVGVFGVASRTAIVTSHIVLAVNSIAAPKFAALHRQGNIKDLAKTARDAAKLTTILASPFLLLSVVAPKWVMQLFGPQFVDGATVLAILAVGQFVNVVTGLVRYLLMMCGCERVVGTNFVIVTIVNIVLCLVLIPWLGVLGAAIATAATVAINNLSLAYHVWTRLGICTIPFLQLGKETRV